LAGIVAFGKGDAAAGATEPVKAATPPFSHLSDAFGGRQG
jgi:hypothetical protein